MEVIIIGTDVQAVTKCKAAPEFPWEVFSKANWTQKSKAHFKR